MDATRLHQLLGVRGALPSRVFLGSPKTHLDASSRPLALRRDRERIVTAANMPRETLKKGPMAPFSNPPIPVKNLGRENIVRGFSEVT